VEAIAPPQTAQQAPAPPSTPAHTPTTPKKRPPTKYIIIALIAAAVLGGLIASGFFLLRGNNNDTVPTTAEIRDRDRNDPTAITATYTAIYREEVIPFEFPPLYSVEINDNIATITVYNPTNAILQLQPNDIFVFESTPQNPAGKSGQVLFIEENEQDRVAIITARMPDRLEEIFYEFHVEGVSDLLALGGEILLSEEFYGMAGLQTGRNPDSLFYVSFENFERHGVTLNGRMELYQPTVSHEIIFCATAGLDIQLLEIATTASMQISASYRGRFDEIMNLARIRVPIRGVFVDIPLGVRVIATGEADADFYSSLEVRFGIRENNPFFARELNYQFAFDFTARVEFMLQLELRLSILGWAELYGVYANLGLGMETSTAILSRCHSNDCFVLGTNIILRISSVRNFGLTRLMPAANFGPIHFMPNRPSHFYYFYNGEWHPICPHRMAAADVYFPLLGEWEGLYTGSQGGDWFTAPTPGPRRIHKLIFHDGFAYRVLANIYPVEGGFSGRVSYYGDIIFDPETRRYSMQGDSLVYNPDGLNWGFVVFEGYMHNGVMTGENSRGEEANWANMHLGSFEITQIATVEQGEEITGTPLAGFTPRQ